MRDQKSLLKTCGCEFLSWFYPCKLKPGSKAAAAMATKKLFNDVTVTSCEFNTKFREQFEAEGFVSRCVTDTIV